MRGFDDPDAPSVQRPRLKLQQLQLQFRTSLRRSAVPGGARDALVPPRLNRGVANACASAERDVDPGTTRKFSG